MHSFKRLLKQFNALEKKIFSFFFQLSVKTLEASSSTSWFFYFDPQKSQFFHVSGTVTVDESIRRKENF
jgi:hypothetical protein